MIEVPSLQLGDLQTPWLELGLDDHCVPSCPVRLVLLDDWGAPLPQRQVTEAADLVRRSQVITVGIARDDLAPQVRVLAEALTLTLTESSQIAADRTCILVDDIDLAVSTLLTRTSASPRAAVAVAQLLRSTSAVSTATGLAAEAAVYSMLLGGPEFRRWLRERSQNYRDRPTGSATPVLVERRDGKLLVALNRPERRNAVNDAMREELLRALDVAVHDRSVAEVRLSGVGPAFCSGGDLDEFGRSRDHTAAYLVRLERAPWRLVDLLAHRVVAQVHGAAVGAGLEIAAFASTLALAPRTRVRLPEIEMGLVPGAGGTVSVTRRIGRWRAAWMMLSAEWINTETALAWGLADRLDDARG